MKQNIRRLSLLVINVVPSRSFDSTISSNKLSVRHMRIACTFRQLLAKWLTTLMILLPSLSISQTWRDTLQYAKVTGVGISRDGYVGDILNNAFVEQRIRFHLNNERLRRGEAGAQRVGTIFVVTTTNDTGDGSFRKAITDANANAGLDMISFNIPPAGPKTITPLSKLPNIVDSVIIDGTTQPGFVDKPMIEINCSSLGPFNALDIFPGNSTVRGLVINRLTGGTGIVLWTNGGNIIEGNFIGTDITGTIRIGNIYNGVIAFSGRNRIGGTTATARNVISGNGSPGIALSETTSIGNVVVGNYIGTNASGTTVLGNSQNGILVINGSRNDTIGGVQPGARNIISGSETVYSGISIIGTGPSGTRGIQVLGNYIGTDVNGTANFGNAGNGIYIRSSPINTIGGTSPGARNIISGNTLFGISLDLSPTTGNTIQGNFIGTNASGMTPLGNSKGIVINNAPNNVIGGTAAGAGNVISGNIGTALEIRDTGSTGNRVEGNYIGTRLDGVNALPNGATGVFVNGAPNNMIGGSAPAARNVIGRNGTNGVSIVGAAATGNKVQHNFIGTDTSATRNLGNGAYGVYIDASQDTIGSWSSNDGNVIANNRIGGVYVASGSGNLIMSNRIFSNSSLGIDLFPTGVTPNDSLDADTGANGLQNFPLLDSAVVSGSTTTVHGRLDGKPDSTYTVEFFMVRAYDSSHFGEGDSLIGVATVTCNDTGTVSFSVTLPLAVPTDKFITATATDGSGNTSEFSQCLCLNDSDGDGIMDCWETQGWGIDVNSDGKIDLDLYAAGARPNHKDIFVEVDAMNTYAPPDSALKMVVRSFSIVPNTYLNNPDNRPGINFHYELDDTTIPVMDFPNVWTDFDSVKKNYFGTLVQRNDTNAVHILQAKHLVYRYCIFARTKGTTDDTLSSGQGELTNGLGGNDFMVTFGSTGANGWNNTRNLADHAGTFMHELGHTLGLWHGGNNNQQYKPNYYSVMNYTWQTIYNWQVAGSWKLDYSPVALPTLLEGSLNEQTGLNPPAGAYLVIPMPFTDSLGNISWARLKPATGNDWTGNNDSTSTSVNVDINLVGEDPGVTTPKQTLNGYADWPNLIYNFRHSPSFKPGVHRSIVYEVYEVDEPEELTREIYNRLNSLPPPVPRGQFLMDGQIDTSAVLLTSNGGINLYAALRGPQLYIATNSAQSQGADMFVFVADARRPLRAAPWSKSGQVAAWSAFLGNESTDNSASWYDAAASALTNITVDTTGTVLEGVIDIEYLLGTSPSTFYLAVGKYQTNDGGTLLAQVPAGDGDGNIDAGEFYQFGKVVSAWSTDPNINNAICTAQNHQIIPTITSDGAGGAIITWSDTRSGSSLDIYAQRINASGVVQWPADGVAISTAAHSQYAPTIVSDGAGSAIITWYDIRSGITYDIYAQRINASGVVQWTVDGVAISTAADDQYNPTIVSDGAGGAIITWLDGRSNITYDIYAQRINASGVVQWTADGMAISTAAGDQYFPTIVSDGTGGAIITWSDTRSGSSLDIYAQRINASGVVQWTADGVAISTAANQQYNPAIVSDGAGGAIITWSDSSTVGANPNIYAQRIGANGAMQWTADGVAISTAANGQYAPAIVSDGAGGAIITWSDYRSGLTSDIYAQRINASGVVQWTADGMAISTAAGDQYFPTAANDQYYSTIVSDGAGGAIITWS
ncbi:MAG: hypothetical protein HY707_13830, partial [Ignavibacteriae bacterium]|nr:hypothetical protein [Ignavibacteriota bacterium]